MNTSRPIRKQRYLDLDARLGQRLAALRTEQGLSQEQVALAMHFGRPLVSKIEHGQRSLNATEIPDYARALGIDPATLCTELLHVTFEYDSSLRRQEVQGKAPIG